MAGLWGLGRNSRGDAAAAALAARSSAAGQVAGALRDGERRGGVAGGGLQMVGCGFGGLRESWRPSERPCHGPLAHVPTCQHAGMQHCAACSGRRGAGRLPSRRRLSCPSLSRDPGANRIALRACVVRGSSAAARRRRGRGDTVDDASADVAAFGVPSPPPPSRPLAHRHFKFLALIASARGRGDANGKARGVLQTETPRDVSGMGNGLQRGLQGAHLRSLPGCIFPPRGGAQANGVGLRGRKRGGAASMRRLLRPRRCSTPGMRAPSVNAATAGPEWRGVNGGRRGSEREGAQPSARHCGAAQHVDPTSDAMQHASQVGPAAPTPTARPPLTAAHRCTASSPPGAGRCREAGVAMSAAVKTMVVGHTHPKEKCVANMSRRRITTPTTQLAGLRRLPDDRRGGRRRGRGSIAPWCVHRCLQAHMLP
eukprot:17590-Chlamydomonas_euryale.AAC.2